MGVLAGVGALAFRSLLELATTWILGGIAGHHPATLAGEGGFRPATGFPFPWAVPLVVAGGALLSTALVLWLAREAAGHGTDAAIAAALNDPKGIRGRVPALKMLTSAITIGSGGSGGSEGPAAQISAGLGSWVARTFRLGDDQARTAVVATMAAGIGAIFRTPLGGALLGAELLSRRGRDWTMLYPSLVASLVAYGVVAAVHGRGPLLGDQTGQLDPLPLLVVAVPLLGLVAGLLGRLFVACFYGVVRWSRRWRLPLVLRPAAAGLAVGALGLVFPGVLGTGYGTAQAMMDRDLLAALPLWLVLAVPLAKLAATSLSIGSGGSGGIFGPTLVIGGTAGAALWRLFDLAGFAPASPVLFVIVGMAACVGSAVHAQLALTVMVVEATSSLWSGAFWTTGYFLLLAPTFLAVWVASRVMGDTTLYVSQLPAARGARRRAPDGRPVRTGRTRLHDSISGVIPRRRRQQPVRVPLGQVPGPDPAPARAAEDVPGARRRRGAPVSARPGRGNYVRE